MHRLRLQPAGNHLLLRQPPCVRQGPVRGLRGRAAVPEGREGRRGVPEAHHAAHRPHRRGAEQLPPLLPEQPLRCASTPLDALLLCAAPSRLLHSAAHLADERLGILFVTSSPPTNPPPGPCATVDQWQSCSFGQVRAHSFMGRQAWAAGATAGWINALSAAAATASSRTQLVALSVLTADALAVAATPANLGGSFGRWFGLDTMQNIAAYRSLNRLTGVPPVPVSAPIEVPSTVVRSRVWHHSSLPRGGDLSPASICGQGCAARC